MGAICFIAKQSRFHKEELEMLADILFKYLKTHYSNHYDLNPKYCIAVDVFKNITLTSAELESGKIRLTLNEIKELILADIILLN